MLVLLSLAVVPSTAMGQPTGNLVPEQAAQEWIRELDADTFAERKRARKELVKIGGPAIRLVQQAVFDNLGNRELQMQSLEVLQALVDEDQPSARKAAIDALTQIAERNGDPRAGNAAKRILADHARLIAIDAWTQLQALGAKPVSDDQSEDPLPEQVVIDQEWRGSADDVRLLGLLTNLRVLKLFGDSIEDAYLAGVSRLNKLEYLHIDDAQVTANGLAKLASLKTLKRLAVRDTPLSNERGQLAAALKLLTVTEIILIRTQLDRTAVAQIAEAIPRTKASLHFGAFMGVGPIDPQRGVGKGCQLGIVTAGSAAAKAGLRADDTIMKYDGKPIKNFEELRDLIGLHSPGDKVTVELHRPKRRRQNWLDDFRIEPPVDLPKQIQKQVEELNELDGKPAADPQKPEDRVPGPQVPAAEEPAAEEPNADYDVLVKEVTLDEKILVQ